MATGKFDLQRFFASPEVVAGVAPADDLFGFLTRKIILPPGVAALITRQAGDQVVCPPGGELSGEGAVEFLLIRTTPVDLSWTEERVVSADRFAAEVTISLRISAVPERGELQSFHTRIMGSDRGVNRDGLVRYLRSATRQALTSFAEQREMEVLVDAQDREGLAKAVADAVAAPCFAAGLTVDPSVNVTFMSPTFRQVRVTEEQVARRREEQAAKRQLQQALETAQQEHLEHLETLLAKLTQSAEASPDVELSGLIRSFSESQRGEIYEALFAAATEARVTQWVVVACGSQLLFYDPASGDAPARTVPVNGEVGAVRSVQCLQKTEGSPRLLIGGARGVYELGVESKAVAATFAIDESIAVRGGINSVALAGERVLATHSEVGLICWERNTPDKPTLLLEERTKNAKAVRNVRMYDGRLYFSVDAGVLATEADNPTESALRIYTGPPSANATITALCPAPDGLYAGNAEGQIMMWPYDGGEATVVHSGSRRPAESIHLLTAGGITRLFFTDTTLAVHTRVIGDTFTCRYEAGGQTLRRVEVAPDLLVATNEVRNRLIHWSPGKPAAPAGTISVARQTGHSVQDVCLLPAG
jgi:hypothetical protein